MKVNEVLAPTPAEATASWPDTFLVKGGWVLTRVKKTSAKIRFNISRLMGDGDEHKGFLSISRSRRDDKLMWVLVNGKGHTVAGKWANHSQMKDPTALSTLKTWLEQEFAERVLGEEELIEVTDATAGSSTKKWPHDIVLKNGWTLKREKATGAKIRYSIGRLMDDGVKGYFYVARRQSEIVWSIHDANDRPVSHCWVSKSDKDPSDLGFLKDWVGSQLSAGLKEASEAVEKKLVKAVRDRNYWPSPASAPARKRK